MTGLLKTITLKPPPERKEKEAKRKESNRSRIASLRFAQNRIESNRVNCTNAKDTSKLSKIRNSMYETKNETIENIKNGNGNGDILEGIDHGDSFCKSGCRVCESGRAVEVQNAVAAGVKYLDIVEKMKSAHGIHLSTASICRHMANYREVLRSVSERQMVEAINIDAENVLVHQARTLSLIKVAYENILTRYQRGLLDFSVDDLDKLTKLFYMVLQNPEQASRPNVAMYINQFDAKFGNAGLFDKDLNPIVFAQRGTNPPNVEDRNEAQDAERPSDGVPVSAPVPLNECPQKVSHETSAPVSAPE